MRRSTIAALTSKVSRKLKFELDGELLEGTAGKPYWTNVCFSARPPRNQPPRERNTS
jgi:hypothetical protein